MELPRRFKDAKQIILEEYNKDPRPSKMLLSSGSMCDAKGNVFMLDSVIEAERRYLNNSLLTLEQNRRSQVRKPPEERFFSTKSYLPISGSERFLKNVSSLIWDDVNDDKIQSIHCPGGTSAIRMAAETIRRVIHKRSDSVVWLSSPTWGNHIKIFEEAGYNVETYPYETRNPKFKVDISKIFQKLESAKKYDVVLFQANCHNPTGVDLTMKQWKLLFNFCVEKSLLLVIDMAFVGMANGVDADFLPIRFLAKETKNCNICLPWFFAVSYSKCFTMYNERVGSLSVISNNAEVSLNFQSQMKYSARACYSNPPARGAEIINILLEDPQLVDLWKKEILALSEDIATRRELFVKQMKNELEDQSSLIGAGGQAKTIFMNIGLAKGQNEFLRRTFGLYNWENHFNILTVDIDNMEHVCKCFATAMKLGTP